MKMKKMVAMILAVSVMGSVAGCSSVKSASADDFIDSCDSLGFDEVDVDDWSGLDDDALADGIYCVMDRDYIEDEITDEVWSFLKLYDCDLNLDRDDIEQIALMVQFDESVFDDVVHPSDIEDIETSFIGGVQITLSDYDADTYEGIMDAADDILDKIHVDVDDLSSSEYRLTKNGGFILLNVNIEDFVDAFVESDIFELLEDHAEDDDDVEDFLEILDELTGCLSFGLYARDENVVVVLSLSLNQAPEQLNDLCSDLKLTDPSRLPSNQDAIDGIIDALDDSLGLYLNRAASAPDFTYMDF